MKISELLSVLSCDTVAVTYSGLSKEIDTSDPLTVAAYGDFIVEKATIFVLKGKSICEIAVKATLCKAG